jgi:hypothetical protein
MRGTSGPIVLIALLSLSGCSAGGAASSVPISNTAGPGRTAAPAATPTMVASQTPSPLGSVAAIPNVTLQSLGPKNLSLSRPAFPSGALVGSGKSNGVIEDPNNPSVLYSLYGRGHGVVGGAGIVNSGGVYKSNDGGQTFAPIDNGLGDGFVDDLWVDPANSSVLVLATWLDGIYRSTNGGANWTLVRSTSAAQFAYQRGTLYCACMGDGVLSSSDAGQTWSVNVTASNGQAFESIGAGKSTVFAATSGLDSEVYRCANGVWNLAYAFSAAQPVAVDAIAVSPLSDDYVTIFNNYYGNTMGTGEPPELYISKDSGTSFNEEQVIQIDYNTWGVNWFWIQAIAYSPTNPTRLFALGQGPLEYTDDFGHTWNPTFNVTTYGSVGDGRNLAILPNASGGDQCFVSSDQGEMYAPDCTTMMNAQQIFEGASTSYTYGVAVSGNTIFVTMQDYGGVVSQDGGQTWNDITFESEGGAVATDPYVPDECIAADPGFAIYTTTNGCAGMLSANPSYTATTPNIYPQIVFPTDWIAFGSDATTIWTFGIKAGQFYYSHDAGTSWQALTTPPDSTQVPDTVDIDPSNPAHVLVGVSPPNVAAANVYASVNSGQSWSSVSGVTNCSWPMSMDFDPAKPLVAVLACSIGWGATGNIAIYRSLDGGNTWTSTSFSPTPAVADRARRVIGLETVRRTNARDSIAPPNRERPMTAAFPIAEGFLEPSYEFQPLKLRFNPQSSTPILALATTAGLYLSGDAGVTWTQVDTNTITHFFDGLAWQNGYLYASTIGQGILRSAAPLQQVNATSSIRRSRSRE